MSLLIATDAVGGVWRYSLALAAGVAAHGQRITLAVMGPAANDGQRAEAAAIPGCTLVHTGLPLEWTLTDGAALPPVIQELIEVAREARASTAHLHTPALAARSWPIPVVAIAHSCMATWWDTVRCGARPPEIAWHAQAMSAGLVGADVSVAPSRAFARLLDATYRPQRPIRAIHNGLPPMTSPDETRTESVLCAGRLWDESKNMAMLDRVAAALTFPVHAAGPCAAPGGAPARLTNLHLLGNLPAAQLHATMAQAAIFASPSLYEPFGLALLEAAALGTPLVLADIPTFRELWAGAAIFAPAGDEQAWVYALTTLMHDPAERRRLGQQAAKRAQHYTQARMVTATMALHQRLCPPARQAA